MSIQFQKIAVTITCDRCKEEKTIYVPANKLDDETVFEQLREDGHWNWGYFHTQYRTLCHDSAYCKEMLEKDFAKELKV
jgi:hypothetical protein